VVQTGPTETRFRDDLPDRFCCFNALQSLLLYCLLQSLTTSWVNTLFGPALLLSLSQATGRVVLLMFLEVCARKDMTVMDGT
jgi:hypothetical protein